MPYFESEAAEAQWWYDHREEHAEHWIKAIREGYVGEGSMGRFASKLRAAEIAKAAASSPQAAQDESTGQHSTR